MRLYLKFNVLIVVLLSITPGLSQRLFIEPDFGIYKPSELSRLDSLSINYGDTSYLQSKQDFIFDYSPRYGVNIGIISLGDYQIYIGYKIWSNTMLNTKFNSFVYGIKGDSFLIQSNLGIRLGLEFSSGKMLSELNTYDPSWEYNFSGTGVSIETGLVYRLHDRIRVFAGLNYLSSNIVLDRIEVGSDIFTRSDVGLSKSKADVDMSGIYYKVGLSFVLTKPLQFEN